MPRVLVVGLLHETHTFLHKPTSRADFTSLPFDVTGPSQLSGALAVAQEQGWDVISGPYWVATPSGMVDDGVLEAWWTELAPLIPAADAIYLDLHGAMVCRSTSDVEGEIISRIRALTDTPLGVTLDLHGNTTQAMCVANAVFCAYRKNPHTDVKESARRTATLLNHLLETKEPVRTVRLQPPLLWPPTGTGTEHEPMRTLEAQARALEAAHPELLSISVFGGFSFSDIAEAGVSFLATTLGDPNIAQSALELLSQTALSLREHALPPRTKLADVTPLTSGTLLLVEPAENVGGGAPGDGTHVLRWLVENDVIGGAVKLYDPHTVAAFWDQESGVPLTRGIGAHSGESGVGEPVVAAWEKVAQSEGAFRLADPHSHSAMFGEVQQMGRSVVLRHRGVTVLVTSRSVPPMDLGPWLSVGLNPQDFSVIGVKAAVAHRQAYDPITTKSLWLDTPGPCDENLARLAYKNIRRPLWPLDEL